MASWSDDKPREPFQPLFWVALGYMTVVIGGCLYALKKAGLW